MAGTIIRAVPKQTFDFTNLASGASAEYVMLKTLDLSQWTDTELWIRVHSTNFGGTGDIDVVVNPTAPSVEDPSEDFVETDTSVTYTIDSSTPVPTLLGVSMSSVSSPAVRLTIKGTQGSTPAAVSAELSIDIVAKAKG